MRLARVAALASFLAIAIGAFQTFYLRAYTFDAAPMRAYFTELPYRKLPGFQRLMTEVGPRTPDGARILVWLPYHQWQQGYSYGYWRAKYLLVHETVIPLLEMNRDAVEPTRLHEAEWVVCYHTCPPPPGFVLAWKSEDGTLWRRGR